MATLDKIRNFCIIAHVDHGKSTLADRILLLTGAVEARNFQDQFLDSNAIERERGITIKAKSVALKYKDYNLNLIDTPGHADFNYEVSKSLAACEGAILVVDATQGVQAQTVANALLAIDAGLHIVPVLNKIDLQHAQIEDTVKQIQQLIGCDASEVMKISGKVGLGVPELVEEVIRRVPAPQGDLAAPLQALIFDSSYDEFRGVVVYVRIRNGTVKKGDKIWFKASGNEYQVEEVGVFMPHMKPVEMLKTGEVGYILANIKNIRQVRVGDTIAGNIEVAALPGYKDAVPMVFCEMYPSGATTIEMLQKAIERMSLNDAAFTFVPQHSDALGLGYHCGFLGLLHMEIIQERLEREEHVELITTAPRVTFFVKVQGKQELIKVDSPSKMPKEEEIEDWLEPMVALKIVSPSDCIGNIMKLCEERRGQFVKQEYIGSTRLILTYDMPFCEIVFDFYDKLKSVTRGYATMDYAFIDYFPSEMCLMRILVAGKEIDALSTVCHKDFAERIGRKYLRILRTEIPKHMFQIALQAAVGGRIIARENISGLKRDVMGKAMSGGDYSRKRKLIEKQKEGRKRLKSVGSVDIPQEAFMAVLRVDEDEE
jgi:GTP-binding protein LepA